MFVVELLMDTSFVLVLGKGWVNQSIAGLPTSLDVHSADALIPLLRDGVAKALTLRTCSGAGFQRIATACGIFLLDASYRRYAIEPSLVVRVLIFNFDQWKCIHCTLSCYILAF